MKNISILILILGLLSFSLATGQNKTVPAAQAKLLVYYFHGTNRCATCLAIEENTKKALQTNFAKEMKDGTVKFQSINVDDEKDKALAEKYQAAGSALWITRIAGGKEEKKDMTNFAFSYGRSNPEKFITGLKEEITKELK
jgi:hypothetical protein